MSTEKVYGIIDQAYRLGYRGGVRFHRLSEGLLDPRYIEFAKYVKAKRMKLFEDTNGDVLRNNPELCSQLDGLVDGCCIGLYDYRDEPSKQKEMDFWKRKFKKTLISFSLPLEFCSLRKNSAHSYSIEEERLLSTPCVLPYYYFMIRWDGEAYFCCEDDLCYFNGGNVFRQPLEEIWWSQKHVQMARKLSNPNSRHCFKHCSSCVFGLTFINLLKK